MRPSFTLWRRVCAHNPRIERAQCAHRRQGAARHLDRPADGPLGDAERSLRFVDRREQVVASASDVAPPRRRHAVGSRRSPRRRRSVRRPSPLSLRPIVLQTSCSNARTLALSSPSVDRPSVDPVPVRADLGALPATTRRRSTPTSASTPTSRRSPHRLPGSPSTSTPSAAVAWNRYPDRRGDGTARRDRRLPRRAGRAGVRRQRLERGHPVVALGVCRRGPHGRRVRADLPAARPHRQDHRRHRRRRRATRRLHARCRPRRQRDRRAPHRR